MPWRLAILNLNVTDCECPETREKAITMRPVRFVLYLLILAMGAVAHADQATTTHRLFHIERNKNANIVVYDAQVMPGGTLPDKDPVVVYWLKLADDGERKKLKGIEKKLAYGFKVKSREGDRLELAMAADVGRNVFVEAVADSFRAFITIDEQMAQLERVFIFASESGLLPKVEYIELFGTSVETGEDLYEKYLP
jgi:hypothetical protein